MPDHSLPRLPRAILLLGILALAVGILFQSRPVLLPLTLAGLLTFILMPPVLWLERRGLPRLPAVLLVLAGTATLLGATCWMTLRQVVLMAHEIPGHQEQLREKVARLRALNLATGSELSELAQEVEAALQPRPQTSAAATTVVPVPITIQPDETPLTRLRALVGSLVEVLGSASVIVTLVFFMLWQREDLRNRLLRLSGAWHVTVATRALGEAAQRISRYLLMLVLINGSYGLAVGIGLYLVGVPYSFLWGFLAAVLRFLPYVGPWVAAVLPLTLSIVVAPGWSQPLLVLGVFLGLELWSNNFMEPWLYGSGVGMSVVALLVAAAFWAWLWGPLGLMLATPLTVCLIVLGRHVPTFAFLDVVLGDRAALEPHVRYYQRLLACDQDEAADLVEEWLREHPVDRVQDALFLPALQLARRDRQQGQLDGEESQFLLQATRDLLDDLVASRPHLRRLAEQDADEPGLSPPLLLGCPARDDVDELALHMLRDLLGPSECRVEILSAHLLSSEVVARVRELQPAALCIGLVTPGGLTHARYLCKRLHMLVPDVRLLVGAWGLGDDLDRVQQRLRQAGADDVAATLRGTRSQVLHWLHVRGERAGPAHRKRAGAQAR